MPVKGKTIEYEEVGNLFSAIPVTGLRETELFVSGDHWQDSKGWSGWRPESSSESALAQWSSVQELFNAKNVCGGIVARVRGASLGREPDWEIVPRNRPDEDSILEGTETEIPKVTPEQAEYAEIDKQLVRWWDEKKVHKHLKAFVSNRAAYGKSALRIHIPKGYVTTDPTSGKQGLSVKNMDDALDKIFISAPSYSEFIDAEDEDFGRSFTALKLKKKETADPDRYELCYVDENKQTVLRQIGQYKNQSVENSVPVNLGGNLLLHVAGEYKDALISETVRRQQRAVNHAKTGENFALANINFPETTFINASLPTEKIDIAGKVTEVEKGMAQGLGRWRNLLGVVTQDATGGEKITTPEVKWRDGADPERFARVASNNTRDMHQEAGMLYIYLADSEYASGDARIEAMTDYLILLVDSKTLLDNTGNWLLTTVLRLAFNLLGQPDKIDKFDVIFSSKMTIGRVSNEDKTVMLDEVSKGLRSKRNYMITTEVADDPSTELKVIKSDGPLKDAQPNAIEVAEAQAKLVPAATSSVR